MAEISVSPDDDLGTLLPGLEAGTRVLLGPGEHHLQAQLVLPVPLFLEGQDPDSTAILGSVSRAVLVLAKGGSMQGLTLRRLGTRTGRVVEVTGGAASFRNCCFRGARSQEKELHAALLVRECERLEVLDCRFEDNQGQGLEVRGATPCTVRGCLFVENRNRGVLLREKSRGVLLDCHFRGNGSAVCLHDEVCFEVSGNLVERHPRGVGICCYSTGEVRIHHNCCSGCFHGIELREQTRALVELNECYDNEINGIVCYEQAAPVIRWNRCHQNGQGGVEAWEESHPRIQENVLDGNEVVGLAFHGSSGGLAVRNRCAGCRTGMAVNDTSSPELLENECCENGCGLTYWEEGAGTARRNRFHHNEGCGVQVGERAQPALLENLAHDNERVGFLWMDSSSGLAEANQSWGNQHSDRLMLRNEARPRLIGNLVGRASSPAPPAQDGGEAPPLEPRAVFLVEGGPAADPRPCPACATAMQPLLLGEPPLPARPGPGQAEADLCPACGALWLAEGQLTLLTAQPAPPPDFLLEEAEPTLAPPEECRCRRCDAALEGTEVLGLRLDGCPGCRGVFLPRGELSRLRPLLKPYG